jgi:hypothetical protein
MVWRMILVLFFALLACETPEDPKFEQLPVLNDMLQSAWQNYDSGNLTAALSEFQQVSRWQVDIPEVHIGIGWSSLYLADDILADESFALARSLALTNEDRIPALVGSGILATLTGDDTLALNWYAKAQEIILPDYQYNHSPEFTLNDIIKAKAGCYLRLGDFKSLQNTIIEFNPNFIDDNTLRSNKMDDGYNFQNALWVELNISGLVTVDSIYWFDTILVVDTLDTNLFDTVQVIDTLKDLTPQVEFELGYSEIAIYSDPRPNEYNNVLVWFHYAENMSEYIQAMILELGTW